ncbi:hypothetical protein QYE76_039385 [Lolium multiflorum]|uniref:Uncharacterized protein n=1 Tax=Lolium multiflorum TaxID=4521 RepID=A0AAD8TAW8_LOLMU|nr:hypothetical protein QYE76_039385 [Lolium multiflorum]
MRPCQLQRLCSSRTDRRLRAAPNPLPPEQVHHCPCFSPARSRLPPLQLLPNRRETVAALPLRHRHGGPRGALLPSLLLTSSAAARRPPPASTTCGSPLGVPSP